MPGVGSIRHNNTIQTGVAWGARVWPFSAPRDVRMCTLRLERSLPDNNAVRDASRPDQDDVQQRLPAEHRVRDKQAE